MHDAGNNESDQFATKVSLNNRAEETCDIVALAERKGDAPHGKESLQYLL